MGHKTIQITLRYAHLAPKHQLAAVQRLCGQGKVNLIAMKPQGNEALLRQVIP